MPLLGTLQYLLITICVLGCAATIVSEGRDYSKGKWVFKPLASTAFILLAYSVGALDSTYGTWILLGLALSWLGDILLIPKDSKRSFIFGIISFLLGHVAYAVGFWSLGLNLPAFFISIVGAVIASWFIYRWLSASLEGPFKAVVPVYIGVIMVMVVTAISAAAHVAAVSLIAGAVLFAVSDIFVARERFVTSGIINRLAGLPMYYIAQLILAFSVVVLVSG